MGLVFVRGGVSGPEIELSGFWAAAADILDFFENAGDGGGLIAGLIGLEKLIEPREGEMGEAVCSSTAGESEALGGGLWMRALAGLGL